MTPASLPRHELAGLDVRVVDASDPTLVGIEGEVLDETENTLLVAGGDGPRQVPKAVATFAFELPDGDVVTVAGERLVARPARRTERRGGSTWR